MSCDESYPAGILEHIRTKDGGPWRFLAIHKSFQHRGKLKGRKIYHAKIGCPLRQGHWLKRFFLTRRDAEKYARRACIHLNRIKYPEFLGRKIGNYEN